MYNHPLRLNKTVFVFVIFLACFSQTHAQLEHVAAFRNVIKDTGSLSDSTYFLLNTKNFSAADSQLLHTSPYLTSVEYISAKRPFPPLWYCVGNPTERGSSQNHNLLTAPMLQPDGSISFYANLTADGKYDNRSGIILYDHKTNFLKITQSNDKAHPINEHVFQLNPNGNGEKLFAVDDTIHRDERAITGNKADKDLIIVFQDIVILDSNDKVVFFWSPIANGHFSITQIPAKQLSKIAGTPKTFDFTHINSLCFSQDGNILVNFRFLYPFKLNRSSKNIMWKLDGADSTSPYVKSNAVPHFAHGFYQKKNGDYVIFSNGRTSDEGTVYMSGLTFSVDESKNEIRLVNKYQPINDVSLALGSYYSNNNITVFNFGFCKDSTLKYGQYQKRAYVMNDSLKVLSEIWGPYGQPSFNIVPGNVAMNELRPVIKGHQNYLLTDSVPGLEHYKWYLVKPDNSVQLQASGRYFTPRQAGTYVVQAERPDVANLYFVSEPRNISAQEMTVRIFK